MCVEPVVVVCVLTVRMVGLCVACYCVSVGVGIEGTVWMCRVCVWRLWWWCVC